MRLLKSVELNCTLADAIKLHGLEPGMLIHLDDGTTGFAILVGDCTPYVRPTNNDGGIGWGYNEDYCTMRVSMIDFYEIPSIRGGPRFLSPPDFRKLAWRA